MSNHEELISQFTEIAGGDNSTARFYLESCNWALEEALSNFLGNQAENDIADIPPAAAVGNSTPVNVLDDSSLPEQKTSNQQTNSGSFGTKSYKSKIATLNDMSQRSSDDEEGQAFYAGGSERSGQQVLGPPKRKNFREQLSDMFRMAQEHGSIIEPSSTSGSPRPSSSSTVTWGQGVRLGQTDNDHTIVNPKGDSKESQQKKPAVILKLWSQGFSINDGELRLYDDPENKEFLETVMRGEIPSELLEMGWMVNVDVEDHRHEDYKKKTSEVKTFRGSGQTLGSPVPNIQEDPVSTLKPSSESASINPEATEKLAIERLKLDAKHRTTSLQIRLADGSRLMAQFNVTHTVGDIRQYIQTARPQYADRNFVLVSSFPTRELLDDSVTIAGAGLENASIMQRLK